MKLLNKALAVWLSIWILCPGGAHHVVELLLDHPHASSSHGDHGFVVATDEHVEHEELDHEDSGEHTVFDHSRDAGILQLASSSVVLPVCPVTLFSESYLVRRFKPSGSWEFIDPFPPQKTDPGRTPFREVFGVYLL